MQGNKHRGDDEEGRTKDLGVVDLMADSEKQPKGMIIDGEGAVLGRLSSRIAKMLIEGKNISLINAEKIRITGHERDILLKYKRLIELKDKSNPEHSPFYSRRPDYFVKRVVRGMLPYKQPKGKEAYKRLKVYMGDAKGIIEGKAHEIPTKKASETYEASMTIKELTEKLGYRQ